jgi:hypothetical protein
MKRWSDHPFVSSMISRPAHLKFPKSENSWGAKSKDFSKMNTITLPNK